MTTKVTIIKADDGHADVMVDVLNSTNITSSHRLKNNEEISLYVYDGQTLTVREVQPEK